MGKEHKKTIIGAIAGDIIGSKYEWDNAKSMNFEMFLDAATYTDDTVLTVAVADCILHDKDFGHTIWEYGRRYEGRGYGGRFKQWLKDENPQPYNSFGNGSAMRVSAVGFAYDDMKTVFEVARQSAEVSHNHPEGIKGAQAVAAVINLGRKGASKQEIREFITDIIGYDLGFSIEGIRSTYSFDVTCQGSVPQAIVAFLESSDYENAVRLAVSIGGDTDTIACMTGGMAAAFYGEIPAAILDFAYRKLPEELIQILDAFDRKFG
jgi:ADP-ribosylglycohydrolase